MQTFSENQTIVLEEYFLDEEDNPINLKKGYPKAKLLHGKEVISVLYPEPADADGKYSVQLTIPEFGFDEATPITLRWYAKEFDGTKSRYDTVLMIQPTSRPEVGDLVLMHDEKVSSFIAPFAIPTNTIPKVTLYKNNDKVMSIDLKPQDIERKISFTQLRFEHNLEPSLDMYLLILEYTNFDNHVERYMQNIWIVTPQMLNCINILESFLNKAKIDNIIPQLEYTQPGMLQNMNRGLALFNGYQPLMTSFNGTNMQGILLDAFVLCASYYALAEQLLAEGMMAFDFTGQAVTLNVDRTPAIESALGRVEQQMQERIPHIKKQLAKAGVTGGDGSNAVPSPAGLGLTVLSNSPTTSRHIWRPGMQHYYR